MAKDYTLTFGGLAVALLLLLCTVVLSVTMRYPLVSTAGIPAVQTDNL